MMLYRTIIRRLVVLDGTPASLYPGGKATMRNTFDDPGLLVELSHSDIVSPPGAIRESLLVWLQELVSRRILLRYLFVFLLDLALRNGLMGMSLCFRAAIGTGMK